uniref:RCC1 domain-containing protein 1 n=1 Tax=Salvator merianae TaxID=96440 RepID=A0A8D0E7I3_SALMN
MEARGGSGVWVSFGFRFGEAATVELQPQALDEDGLVLGVRPSWSFVGIRRAEAVGAASHEPSRSPSSESPPVPVATSSHMPPVASRRSPPRVLLLRQGAPGWVSPLPADCLDVLPSETHLLLLRKSALESWSLDSAEGDAEPQPVWRRPLLPEEAVGAGEPILPLVPGGYVLPRPPFFEPLPPALRARSLALGHEHAVLLVTAGTVFAWGSGRHGQLGHGDLEGHAEPQPVEALQGLPQEQVAAGGWHSASISETGDLYVWGWNESGQLALPSKSAAEEEMLVPEASREPNLEDRARPGRNPFRAAFISIQAFPALLDLPQEAEVSKISCGSRHTAAVTRKLPLLLQGKYGQLGHRDRVSSDRPKRVCYFVEHSLYVTEVVCGPWTTYVQAVDRKESDLP